MEKLVEIDTINTDKLDSIKKNKLIENKTQLTDEKKEIFGFDLSASVIDVYEDGYSICHGDDTLYTYGIDPCCGLVLCDENVRILFHLDGAVTPEEVLAITDRANLSEDTMAIIIPGSSCGIDGSFDYKQIEEEYKRRGYEVIEQRIAATFGFITVESDKIIIGTDVDRSLDVVLPVPKRNIQMSSVESNDTTIQELNDLKNDLINSNNYISPKSR